LSSLHTYRAHQDLHSFPTRRSSDLRQRKKEKQLLRKYFPISRVILRSCTRLWKEIRLPSVSWIRLFMSLFPQRKKTSKSWLTLRSEEHTSELQSRFDLVCRLLLEKK